MPLSTCSPVSTPTLSRLMRMTQIALEEGKHPPESRLLAIRPEVRHRDLVAGGREAPRPGAPAAVGEVGDAAVRASRDEREAVPPELLDMERQPGVDVDGARIDRALAVRHADAPGRVPIALRAVRVPRGPDEDGLLVGVRLRERADRLAVARAQIGFGEGVDQADVPEAEIEEVETPPVVLPGKDLPEDVGVLAVPAPEDLERDGVVVLRCGPERDREDRKIGSMGNAVRVVEDARDRGRLRRCSRPQSHARTRRRSRPRHPAGTPRSVSCRRTRGCPGRCRCRGSRWSGLRPAGRPGPRQARDAHKPGGR